MTTLNEVAQHAGVTPATVSNVLRSRGRVGAATRQRVLDAVSALGYRPHLTARALAEGRAPTLALMVSSIANPFYPEFALAAERAARSSGHFMIVCNTNEDPEVGRAYLEQIAGTLSEGVLVMNANLHFDDLHKTEQRGAPVVLCMWERPDQPPDLPCVAVDFRAAGAIAAQHLLDLGHTRIGAIIGSKRGGIHAARQEGFRDTLRAAGVPHPQSTARFAHDSIRGGYQAARSLLEAHPQLTAIFASNDLPALGAMHAAADLGLRVPQDLSVVGITDIELARESRPALSTVAVPTRQAAEMAVDLLRQLIERAQRGGNKVGFEAAGKGAADGGTATMRVTSPPVLMARASTAPPRSSAPAAANGVEGAI